MNIDEARKIVEINWVSSFWEGTPKETYDLQLVAKGFLEGHAAGVEKERKRCAEIADNHNGCVDVKCLRESNCGATIANEILKGDGE